MTYFVKKTADTIEEGVANMIAGANEDYNRKPFIVDLPKNLRDTINKEFAEDWTIKTGPKYVKIMTEKGGAWGFVVKGDNDKKFKKGDILKPAGWATPARNSARGNVLEGGYPVNWTGPLYLV